MLLVLATKTFLLNEKWSLYLMYRQIQIEHNQKMKTQTETFKVKLIFITIL